MKLAFSDYETRSGRFPIPRDIATRYLDIAYPDVPLDRSILHRALGEYIGSFDEESRFAEALARQSNLNVDLGAWPYSRIDWTTAAEDLSAAVADDRMGAIVRIGPHYFLPTGVV